MSGLGYIPSLFHLEMSIVTILLQQQMNTILDELTQKITHGLPINIIGLENIVAFHDREIKVYGSFGLKSCLNLMLKKNIIF